MKLSVKILYCVFLVALFNTRVYAYDELPSNNPKVIIATKIMVRIAQTFGSTKIPPRLIIIRDEDKIIAEFRPNPTPIVLINEKVYDLCSTLGKESEDAFSLVIAHELAHYYLNHDWFDTYGLGRKTAKDITAIQQIEKDADYYGCFYAQLAGFNPQVLPKIIDMIYDKYHLDNNILGYPNQEFRKKNYLQKQKELTGLVTVFEAGKSLYVAKEFSQAASCFEEISKHFASAEILNNIGACYLQYGLIQMEVKNQTFIYPIEFDVKTRLASVRGEKIDDNVKKSIIYFDAAINADKQYLPAKINWACANDILNNSEASIGILKQEKNLTADAHSILGIAYIHDSKFDKAAYHFEKAKNLGGFGANYNWNIFKTTYTFRGKIENWITKSQEAFADWLKKTNTTTQKNNKFIEELINSTQTKPKIVEKKFEVLGNKFLQISLYKGNVIEVQSPRKTYRIYTIQDLELQKTYKLVLDLNSFYKQCGAIDYKVNLSDIKQSVVYVSKTGKVKVIFEINANKYISKCSIIEEI